MLSPTEIIVEKIWTELFHLEKITPNDNFFEMGGDSIMTLTMLFQINDILGVTLRPEVLMNAPTLGEFCRFIDRKKLEVLDTEANDIIRCTRKDRLSVSFIQEQVVGAELSGLYDPDKTRSHCLALCYRIEGKINIPVLDKALSEIVQRHEILRTSYSVTDGIIYQNVNDAPQSILHVDDLRHLSHDDREREIERTLKKIAADSFSFFHDKLMISATLIVGKKEHILAVVVNHVAIDGLSMTILKDELFLLYRVYSYNAPSPLSDLPIQYADFAVWERRYFSGERLESKLAYWRRLSSEPLNTALPVDHVSETLSYAGDIVPITILPELVSQLRQLGRKNKATLFTVMFATFIALIHAFSGYRYNFFCIPTGNVLKETRSLIGCFMNFQFIYIDLSGNPTFLELVERLNRALHGAYDNYVPFHFITREIPPQGPVVDFQLLPAPGNSTIPNDLLLFPFRLQPQEFALFPIDVYLLNSSETITGHFKYQTAAYDRNTISDMANDYMSLLTRMVHDPDVRLNDMGIKPHRSVI